MDTLQLYFNLIKQNNKSDMIKVLRESKTRYLGQCQLEEQRMINNQKKKNYKRK